MHAGMHFIEFPKPGPCASLSRMALSVESHVSASASFVDRRRCYKYLKAQG